MFKKLTLSRILSSTFIQEVAYRGLLILFIGRLA